MPFLKKVPNLNGIICQVDSTIYLLVFFNALCLEISEKGTIRFGKPMETVTFYNILEQKDLLNLFNES